MVSRTRKKSQYRRRGKGLIATNRIKPQLWNISDAEVKEALKAKGYEVKQVKKIHKLKHQICISYWDVLGNICSSFFSYRIFARWEKEVEKLIYNCPSIKEWAILNHVMNYEFAYYHYKSEVEQALYAALENRLCMLKATSRQTVFSLIEAAVVTPN